MILLASCLFQAVQGCTYRGWYEGFQERQREACYKNPSQGEVQNCLDRVNSMTYEEYRKARANPEDPAR